ncbi:MAG: tyrosine/phenylalanine carboxypeptidase domain-containing protein [archaeon]|jgi:uncharacterized protein (TIGR02421 family)
MNEKIKKFDEEIFNLSKSIEKNSLAYINPINSIEQKEIFFNSLKRHAFDQPFFKYEKAAEEKLDQIKTQALILQAELKNSLIEKVLKNKLENLLLEIELLKSANTPKFCNSSKNLYQKPSTKLVKLANEKIKEKTIEEKPTLPPIKAKELLEEKMKKINTGFLVSIEDHLSAKASHHAVEKKIKLNKNVLFSEKEIERLFVHEVQTHVYRYLNGLTQPVKCLAIGSGGEFIRTEEGLAVFNEKKAGVSSAGQMRTYAGRVLAVDYALKHDFLDTFDYLKNYFSENEAYTITQRVKRGIPYSKKGAFTKDYVYFAGLIEIEEFVNKGGSVKELFYGKISTKELGMVKKISGIKEPIFLPKSYLK